MARIDCSLDKEILPIKNMFNYLCLFTLSILMAILWWIPYHLNESKLFLTFAVDGIYAVNTVSCFLAVFHREFGFTNLALCLYAILILNHNSADSKTKLAHLYPCQVDFLFILRLTMPIIVSAVYYHCSFTLLWFPFIQGYDDTVTLFCGLSGPG